MVSRKDAYDIIERIQETDMEKAIMLEDMISDYRQKVIKELDYVDKINETFVEKKMEPIYNEIVKMGQR